MNQYRCEYREMTCHKNEPCGFQEFGDEESEVIFCSSRSIEGGLDKAILSGAIFDNTKRMVDEIRQSERDKVLDKLDARIDHLLTLAISRGIRIGLEEAKGEITELRQQAGEHDR